MAATWYINAAATNTVNVSNLRITLRNHADDVATWTCEGDGIADASRWAYGSSIVIKKGSTVVFRGIVTSIPRQGTGEAESVAYEARGGWYWLGKCYYTQSWPVKGDHTGSTTQSKTRVILGYGPNGPVSPDAQLKDILDCAIAAGAPVGYSSGDFIVAPSTLKLPADEQVDLTCADAVNRILAWFPDTVVWFDHAAAKFCFVRRANLPDIYLPVARAAESVSARPRHDLVVPGVEIVYEITSASNNKRFRDVVVDRAGTTSGSGSLGAARFTIQLDGGHANYLFNTVKTQTVSAADLHSPAWWAARVPELAGWTNVSFSQWPSLPTVGTRTLGNELVEGAIQPWQDEVAQTVTFTAKVSYTSAEGDVFADRLVSATLTMTDAATGIYSFLKSRQAAEDVPSGLAAQIYNAVKHLYYEGQIKFVGEDPPDTFDGETLSVGHILSLEDGLEEWEEMSSAIQAIEYAVDSGATTVSFGPPEHLGPQDLVQLALANRKRLECRSQKLYASSEIGGTGSNTIGGPATLRDTGAGGGTVAKQTYADPNDRVSQTNGTVDIDSTGRAGKTAITPNSVKVTDYDFNNYSNVAELTGSSLTFPNLALGSLSFPTSVDVTMSAQTAESDGALIVKIGETSRDMRIKVYYRPITIRGGIITHLGSTQSYEVPIYLSSSSLPSA